MKTFLSILLGLAGVIVLFVGAVLPLRLPRSERNMGVETIAAAVGVGLAVAPLMLNRKKKT